MRAGWIVGVALVSACSRPHVTLPTVPPNLLPEQRVQMFYQLAATREKTVVTTSCGAMGGCSTNVQKTLYLANGTQVYHPEDLLPVVGPDSATARAIDNVHRQRGKARTYAGVSLACAAGFFTIMFLGFGDYDGFSAPEKLGLLATGGGALVGAFFAWHHTHEATASWGEANESYNGDLAQRLGVCTSGLAVVPCESAPPSPSPSSPSPGLAPLPPSPSLPAPLPLPPPPAQPGATRPPGR